MKHAPHILGAVAIAAIVGALSGAAIADTPILTRAQTVTPGDAPLSTVGNAAMRNVRPLPNHYPLETPKGTIEVAELALHGRLRDRGGDMWWEREEQRSTDLDAKYDFYATASPERIAHERRLLAFTEGPQRAEAPQPPPPPSITRAEAPMALAEPAAVASPTPSTDTTVPAAIRSAGSSRSADPSVALATTN